MSTFLCNLVIANIDDLFSKLLDSIPIADALFSSLVAATACFRHAPVEIQKVDCHAEAERSFSPAASAPAIAPDGAVSPSLKPLQRRQSGALDDSVWLDYRNELVNVGRLLRLKIGDRPSQATAVA